METCRGAVRRVRRATKGRLAANGCYCGHEAGFARARALAAGEFPGQRTCPATPAPASVAGADDAAPVGSVSARNRSSTNAAPSRTPTADPAAMVALRHIIASLPSSSGALSTLRRMRLVPDDGNLDMTRSLCGTGRNTMICVKSGSFSDAAAICHPGRCPPQPPNRRFMTCVTVPARLLRYVRPSSENRREGVT